VFAKIQFFLLGLKHIKKKNWLFSVSEAGAKANAICLSIAETAKANGVDFYRYLLKLLTDFPNLDIYPHSEILNQFNICLGQK
jgi:transposase